MIYQFCAQTDPGRVRANNEDAFAFDAATQLGVLADGMGGYNAGEIASGMAATFIKSEMATWLAGPGSQARPRDILRAMHICVDNANSAIFHAATTNPQYAGMGTTLVVCVFQGESLLLGHIGDSRCYRLRQGKLTQITKDHSLLQEQLDAGLISPAQALTSVHKNLVTRALGVEEVVLLELHEHTVEPGDLFLLCSDGLSDMVRDPDIAHILDGPETLEQKVDQLVTVANEHGGRDNITVMLVQAGPTSEKRGLMSRLLGK